jgi:hypothetical protein
MTSLKDISYETLLELLRRDLRLDGAVDLIPGSYASLVNAGIDRGATTLTFSASTNSNTITVPHRLPVPPAIVVAAALAAPAFGEIALCNVSTPTASSFNLNAEVKTSFTGTVTVVWLAVI